MVGKIHPALAVLLIQHRSYVQCAYTTLVYRDGAGGGEGRRGGPRSQKKSPEEETEPTCYIGRGGREGGWGPSSKRKDPK